MMTIYKTRPFRGYIHSRPINGVRTPQHVQNLVIRDFSKKLGLTLSLSATEYAFPSSFLVLNQQLREIKTIGGLVFFSIEQLPKGKTRRMTILNNFVQKERAAYFAAERISIKTQVDLARVEDLFDLLELTNSLPQPYIPS
jgi:sporadic carbohydrate cluster protein (TIGR04323 family)